MLCLILFGWHSRHRLLGKWDLLKYVNDPGHGLVRKTTVEGVDVGLSFEPSSLLVAQELIAAGKRDTSLLRGFEKKYSTNYYFLLKFSRNNKELIR